VFPLGSQFSSFDVVALFGFVVLSLAFSNKEECLLYDLQGAAKRTPPTKISLAAPCILYRVEHIT